MDETKIEPIRNRSGYTYYEWLTAADGTSHANGRLHRQWVDDVDPAEVKAAFDLELRQIRERLAAQVPGG